jgi:protein-S-isoprenylcysteine O-methyltransferase Ste14
VIEVLLVMAPASSNNAIARAVQLNSASDVYISGRRLFGGIFCLTGAALRWLCYREMAHQFTFHITVMKDHKLVTSGPYAYVRHPSYTGGLLLDLGVLIWHLAPGSWLIESGIRGTAMFWILVTPSVILMCFSTRMHFWRCRVEDDIMRKEFGKQWDEWANAVQYKLLPRVF